MVAIAQFDAKVMDDMDKQVFWGILRFMHGDMAVSDEIELTDGELDLDDFQFWFRKHPDHPEHIQLLLNLSGAQWDAIKDLPMVKDRTATE